jgi:hypothetical protein
MYFRSNCLFTSQFFPFPLDKHIIRGKYELDIPYHDASVVPSEDNGSDLIKHREKAVQ